MEKALVQRSYAGLALYKFMSIDKEADAARDLIRQGRENGVDEMTIRLRKTAAVKLGGQFDGQNIGIDADFGNEVEIRVKYKE